jgi:hypothetical protein
MSGSPAAGRPTSSVAAPAEPSICVGCGLCCDGTILSHLAVADESDLGWPLRMLGVELIVQSEPPVFALRPAVVDGGAPCTTSIGPRVRSSP